MSEPVLNSTHKTIQHTREEESQIGTARCTRNVSTYILCNIGCEILQQAGVHHMAYVNAVDAASRKPQLLPIALAKYDNTSTGSTKGDSAYLSAES